MFKKNLIIKILLSVLVLIFLISCSQNVNDNIDSVPKPIYSFYTNDLWNVDRIEVLRSDGTRKSSDNLDFILNWLYKVGQLTVTSDPTPEDYNGVAYTITLFHGEEKLFFLTLTEINGYVILKTDELLSTLSSLWESDALKYITR